MELRGSRPGVLAANEPLWERAPGWADPQLLLEKPEEGDQAQALRGPLAAAPLSCPTPRSLSRASGDSSLSPWPAASAALRCGSAETWAWAVGLGALDGRGKVP